MRSVRDIPLVENIPILVRGALNVPIDAGRVANAYRLRRAVPTLEYLARGGARVVLISHLGEQGTETLAPVTTALGRLVSRVSFCPETTGPQARAAVRMLLPGHILVLENLRRSRGEVMNDPAFAHELASLADVFVEDSFDTCHREHASIVGVPALLPSYAGLLLEEEVAALRAALTPKAPSIAILGGAKFTTKEPVLKRLLEEYTRVFVSGALANDFFKAAGHEVGKSLVGTEHGHIKDLLAHPKLVLPTDVLVAPAGLAGTPEARTQARVAAVNDVHPDEMILDQGPATNVALAELVDGAKNILWNGPLGNYESGFVDGTDALAQVIAASNAHSVVGGGDTIASIEKLGVFSKFSFVSTGGGAMLEYLAHGTLPGITALG